MSTFISIKITRAKRSKIMTTTKTLPHNYLVQNLVDARDDITRLQQQLRSALDNVQQQLRQSQAKRKRRNYWIRRAQYDAKKKVKQTRAELQLASDTESDLRRQVTELQQQQQLQKANDNKLGKFFIDKLHAGNQCYFTIVNET